MQLKDRNTLAFLTLVGAGLWEKKVQLKSYGVPNYNEIIRLAEEQSIVGIITAGLENVTDIKVPKSVLLKVVGYTLQLEKRNTAMNLLINVIVDKMSMEKGDVILLKGQGIAQCYERPLWRSSGDIDLFLNDDNFYRARDFLTPMASSSHDEGDFGLHQVMVIDSWVVELHGDIRNGLSRKMDNVLEEVQHDVLLKGEVRLWKNSNTAISLPCADDDVLIVFTHIIKHLFRGGIGLRQICDWCRLLWTYRETLDRDLLKSRIDEAGLMTEWKAFAALAVRYLGMSADAMPMYDESGKWERKAAMLMRFVLAAGNFGHNKDVSYQFKYKGFIRKIISFWYQLTDSFKLFCVFPVDSFLFLVSFTVLKTRKTIKEK